MSNRFYFTLMGICLIGIFFFLLKMLGTELQLSLIHISEPLGI